MATKRPINKRCCTVLPGKLTDEDVYKMMMLHKYQRKSCAQLAREFGITQGDAYNLIAKRQIGGCCG